MVFWALAEHEEVVQRHKDAGRAEGRAEMVKKYESRLAIARERAKADGIDFDKYFKPYRGHPAIRKFPLPY